MMLIILNHLINFLNLFIIKLGLHILNHLKKTENVVEYVGRYSFRVDISNQRIKNIENDKVTIEYIDYKDNKKVKEMTITGIEFIRRFLLHVLPDNFTKIKHYGLLSNRDKKKNIRFCRFLISKIISIVELL